ncbi:MAG TPA: hypothetical protein VHM89_06660 [Acidimicrobiales bacterium]|nr:hypothetical protein [Acidimicrobiales bacterium]
MVRQVGLVATMVALGAATFTFAAAPASADVGQVIGGAYGHWTNVSLFGGPSSVRGPNPTVSLPPTGADPALIGKVPSASAVYGPATIFGGKWPIDQDTAPPSGPITVSTKGTTGPGGSVTSTVDIVLRTPANPASPGGFGPTVPNEGDELHSSCTANESGVTGSVRFVNAILATSTDESGEPKDTEPIPDNPPVNYTRTGEITNVGDHWRIVYNEQIKGADGSLTVNAIHMFLLGEIAVGEQIVGQVRCGVTHVDAAPATTTPTSAAPATTTPTTAKAGKATTTTAAPAPTTAPVTVATDTSVPVTTAEEPTTTTSSSSPSASLKASNISDKKSGSSALPLLLVGVGLVATVAVVVPWTRRRRMAGGEPPPNAEK